MSARCGHFVSFLVLFSAITMVFPPSGTAQGAFPSELKTVDRVKFSGRHHVGRGELRAVMKTRSSSRLPWRSRTILRLDFVSADTASIAAVYRQHGFLQASVGAEIVAKSDARRADVVFKIDEGSRSRVEHVAFSGVQNIPEESLRRRLYARPGRPFNPGYLVADTARISEAYQERGFRPHLSAWAEPKGLEVTVHYDVNEGPSYRFGQVLLSSPGDIKVARRLIDRELLIKPGDLFRRSRITRSVEHLYDTGLFSQVQVTPLPIDSLIVVDLRVRERKPRWIDAGIGSGTYERLSIQSEWGHRNLAGQGLQGTLSSKLSFDGKMRFLLTRTEGSVLQPWMFHTRTRGQVTAYYEKRDDRTSDSLWVVHQQAPGLTFQARREFGRYTRLTLAEDNAFVKQQIEFLRSIPDSVRDSLLRDVPPSYTTHRLTLSLDRDLRDNPLRPTRGALQNVGVAIAGGPLRGTSSFTRWQGASSVYLPLANGWVFAARARGGLIRPFGSKRQFSPGEIGFDDQVTRVPLEDRFRLGGVNSLRGFTENSIPVGGGLALVQANLEMRVPVVGPLGLEFYVDAGNVWARPSYMKLKQLVPRSGRSLPDPGDVRYVFGSGARLDLPFGPLRLDFTWSPRPVDVSGQWLVHKLQFAIGPSF